MYVCMYICMCVFMHYVALTFDFLIESVDFVCLVVERLYVCMYVYVHALHYVEAVARLAPAHYPSL